MTATPTHPSPTPSEPVSLGAFALTIADVPLGLSQTLAQFHSNEEVASTYGIDPKELQRRGRITSYETEFEQHSLAGMQEVDDVVASWRTPSGAHWDYQRVVQSVTHPSAPQIDVTTMRASGLGDEHTAFSFRSANQRANVIDYSVIFRRGSYRVYLQVVALVGTVTDGEVLHLARVIDRRIERSQ